MFGLGPAYIFLVQHRYPAGEALRRWRSWVSPMATYAAIATVLVAAMWLVGVRPFLLVHLPIVLLAEASRLHADADNPSESKADVRHYAPKIVRRADEPRGRPGR